MHLAFPRNSRLGAAIALSLALAACGGSSYDQVPSSPPPPPPAPVPASTYAARSLVVDNAATPGYAGETDRQIDPKLVNAWGWAASSTGVAWVANQGSGFSTLYDGNGVINALSVAMPGTMKPTGMLFNSAADFKIATATATANSVFLFAGDGGQIAGWSPAVDRNNAILAVDNAATGALYRGLAGASANGANLIYATDFKNRRIDAFDGKFAKVTLAGNFTDPALPAGYAPFGIQQIDGKLFVTYAQQNGSVLKTGAGLGMISVFDTAGNFKQRLVSPGGALNAPWGLAKAPADFGAVSGKLLVANNGDGKVVAFDIDNGVLVGALSKADKTPLVIDGLRGLGFGNGAQNQPTNTLYFTAGPGGGLHGAYGRIDLK